MNSTMTTRKKLTYTANALIAVFYIVYGYACAVLFFRQSMTDGSTYVSDLPAHVHSGLTGTGYSLMEVLHAVVIRITGDRRILGCVMSLMMIGCILVSWRIICELVPEVDQTIAHIAAIICSFVTAYYLPQFNDYRYLGVQSGNIYHNSTFLGMKLCGMVVLFFYFRYMNTYDKNKKGLTIGQWLIFCASLIGVCLMKPNFLVAFAPAMGIYLLIDLFANKGKTFPQIFKFGLAVIPCVFVLIIEYTLLFPSGSGGGIEFSVAYCLKLRARTPWLTVFQTMIFPMWVLLFNLKNLKKIRQYGFSWLLIVISFLEYIFITEAGERRADGNLSWGYCYFIFVIFVSSAAMFCRELTARFLKKDGETAVVKNKPLFYYIIGLLLLAGHFYFGLQYFNIIIHGGTYA